MTRHDQIWRCPDTSEQRREDDPLSNVAERVSKGAQLLDERGCEAVWEFLGIEAPCDGPAIGLFRRACIHEHIRDGWLCRDHAETPERGLCRTCFDLPGELSHECPISITDVTAEAAS